MVRDPDAPDDPDEQVLAGSFSEWLAGAVRAVRDRAESDVPCDGCTACCESSQFVHIEPDETDVLADVPAELLVPAPGLPRGHVLLGYDDHGRCPMLVDRRCSIYAHRPRTCRTYDCRVFPASGVEPDPAQPAIADRVGRWRFDHPGERDRADHLAVRTAASFLEAHPEVFDGSVPPGNATGLALAAVVLHEIFLGPTPPEPAVVRVEISRRRGRSGQAE